MVLFVAAGADDFSCWCARREESKPQVKDIDALSYLNKVSSFEGTSRMLLLLLLLACTGAPSQTRCTIGTSMLIFLPDRLPGAWDPVWPVSESNLKKWCTAFFSTSSLARGW